MTFFFSTDESKVLFLLKSEGTGKLKGYSSLSAKGI